MSNANASPNANAPRVDLFTPIHKALRRLMFDAAVTLGRTDFGSPEETAAAARAVTVCLEFLREHAEHEDRRVVPVIARLAPGLATALAVEHPELERAAAEVDDLWAQLAPLAGAARAAVGAELARRFHVLIAAQLRHMDREEREVSAVFWAELTDAELGAVSTTIVGDIGAARMAAWGEIIGAAMSRPEREVMAARAAAATKPAAA